MKKTLLFAAFTATMILTSCGTKRSVLSGQPQLYKQAPSSSQQITEIEVQLSACEEMSFDLSDGKLRAFGTGIDEDPGFARQIAIANAKGQLTQDMQSLALYAIDIYKKRTKLNKAKTSEENINSHISIVAENMMKNTTTLKTAKFMQSTGEYRYEACVSSVELAEKVVEEIITTDEELKVDYDREAFIQSYQDGLNRFREERK